MKRTSSIYALTLLLLATILPSRSKAADAQIGAWTVHTEKDPFSPKKKTMALVTSSSEAALAIRCLGEDGLSVIILMSAENKTFEAGTRVGFKYRADEGEIVEDKGQAFGEHAIEMPNARQILDDAQKAATLYVRMETPSDTTLDMQFKTRGANKALAGIKTDCPLDTATSAEKSDKETK